MPLPSKQALLCLSPVVSKTANETLLVNETSTNQNPGLCQTTWWLLWSTVQCYGTALEMAFESDAKICVGAETQETRHEGPA